MRRSRTDPRVNLEDPEPLSPGILGGIELTGMIIGVLVMVVMILIAQITRQGPTVISTSP